MYTSYAQKTLSGTNLSTAEMHAVLQTPDRDILPLLHAAYQVRHHYLGAKYKSIADGCKSGLCPKDCAYCSNRLSTHSLINSLRQAREMIDEPATERKRRVSYCHCYERSGPPIMKLMALRYSPPDQTGSRYRHLLLFGLADGQKSTALKRRGRRSRQSQPQYQQSTHTAYCIHAYLRRPHENPVQHPKSGPGYVQRRHYWHGGNP